MMATIITAVDFSEVTNTVLAETIEMARAFDCTVTVMHVVQYVPETTLYEGEMILPDLPMQEMLEENSEKLLRDAQKKIQQAGIECEMCLRDGSPSHEILQYVKNENPRMVIIGSHGHGALYHLVLGSVSEKIVDKVACPVLVVKQYEE
jgi:nucleotide-binding universal stress UspA family protein